MRAYRPILFTCEFGNWGLHVTPDKDASTAVLLGAGFNADAKAQAGPIDGYSIYNGRHEIQCGYPLASDLAELCFGIDRPPAGRSIEDLFQEAQEAQNAEPMRHLAEVLMKADYYLPAKLIPAFGARSNPYASFFDRFADCHFITFNYDSLPELFLLNEGTLVSPRWLRRSRGS